MNLTDKITFSGDIALSGQIFGVSDSRLKKNTKQLSKALPILMTLNPMTYEFIDQHSELQLAEGQQYGLIAQEVETVLPSIVDELITKEETYKTINYDALIPILVGAIQEQQKEIDTLKKMIDEKYSKK